eukprot:12209849-Karenia_brevis.AAC.1
MPGSPGMDNPHCLEYNDSLSALPGWTTFTGPNNGTGPNNPTGPYWAQWARRIYVIFPTPPCPPAHNFGPKGGGGPQGRGNLYDMQSNPGNEGRPS